jgi:hypothetical protein
VEKAVRTIGTSSKPCIILNGLEDAGVPDYMRDRYESQSEESNVGSA